MDINKVHPGQVSERRLDKPQERQIEDRQVDQEERSSRAEVSLSDSAKSLARANTDSPHFDAARVDAIRQAIAQGRYHVDPERLAERFISLEKQINQ
ncbi:MAG: flagellar biosynthesis anti-sigma factor FlgM [Pseudomonadales bacterium]|nr:flagellar biosynthesis anti-sigma factor FlgM [Pseudomonadales bacterium]